MLLVNNIYYISRIIQDQSKWICIKSLDIGFHTPFNCLKRNWLTVYPETILDTTNRINSWSPEGDILTLVITHEEPMKIHLDQMKPAVDLLFSDLTTALTELSPDGINFPPKVQWEPKDSLGTKVAFVDQSAFKKAISPLYNHFTKKMSFPDEPTYQIFSDNTFQVPKFKE